MTSDKLTESILKKVGLGDLLPVSRKQLKENDIYFDAIPLPSTEIIDIDVGEDNPVIQAIQLTIKSGERIPTSTMTGKPCDFYEEVNFHLRGMGEQLATAKEIKETLLEMANKQKSE